MSSGSGISGSSIFELTFGGILIWAGIENASITAAIRSLVGGKKPAPNTGTQPITSSGGSSTTAAAAPAGLAGGHDYITPAQAYDALVATGLNRTTAIILTAVGGAESEWNLDALNNDAATGDYSVGVWQINYYGANFAPRSAQFGPPQQLLGNLKAQAQAAAIIYGEQGLSAWTTYTSGAYSGFLTRAFSAASPG